MIEPSLMDSSEIVIGGFSQIDSANFGAEDLAAGNHLDCRN